MKHLNRWHWFFAIFLFWALNVPAQQGHQPLEELEQLFKQFQFQEVLKKGRYYLGEPGLTRRDSLAIYEYMLNAAYALNDTAQAKSIIDEILTTDPNFQPNPKITSPKIMEFYHWYRKNRKPLFPRKPPTQIPDTARARVVKHTHPLWEVGMGILLPGSSEYLRTKQNRYLLKSGVSALLLGGMIYAIQETAQREKAYLNARQNFDYYYNRYNAMFKIRSLSIAVYSGWIIWHVYRLLNTPPLERQHSAERISFQWVPSIHPENARFTGYLQITWQL